MLEIARAVRTLRRRRPAARRGKAAPTPTLEERLSTVERALGRGREDEAHRHAMALAGDAREDPTTLNRVGDLFVRLAAADSAVACYLAAADHHLEDGFHAKASALYRKALRLDPDHVVARARLAGLYHQQGLAAEAALYGSPLCAAARG